MNDFLHFLPLGIKPIFRLASLTINARTSREQTLQHIFLGQGKQLLQQSWTESPELHFYEAIVSHIPALEPLAMTRG